MLTQGFIAAPAEPLRCRSRFQGAPRSDPEPEGSRDAVPSTADPIELDLFRRVRVGDEDAFSTLFRRLYADVATFALRLTDDRELAEEVAQDIFVRLWLGRAEVSRDADPRAYLFRAARNRVIDRVRHRDVRRLTESDVAATYDRPPTTPSQNLEHAETRERYARTLRALPPRCREVFLLSRDGGLTHPQIAEALGLSVKTVEAHVGRALRQLRAALLTTETAAAAAVVLLAFLFVG